MRVAIGVINFVAKLMESPIISIFEACIKVIYTELSTIFVDMLYISKLTFLYYIKSQINDAL